MWRGKKKIISSNSSIQIFPTAITVNNETITNPSNIANAFNNYFAKVTIKSFDGKLTEHRFSSYAVNQIQNDDPESADVVIIGPPTGGQSSDLENEDEEILNTTGLPEEIAGEVEVLKIRKDKIERMTSDGEDSDVEPPPAKQQKQNVKKSKINVKWQKQHLQTQTFSSFYQDKTAQAVFLENSELVELTMWTLIEKVVSPLIELLLHETNRFANRDKNKPQFKVTLEELKNFIGLYFLSGYNTRLAE